MGELLVSNSADFHKKVTMNKLKHLDMDNLCYRKDAIDIITDDTM
jgi:hypothetical protein